MKILREEVTIEVLGQVYNRPNDKKMQLWIQMHKPRKFMSEQI